MTEKQLIVAAKELCRIRSVDLTRESILAAATEIQNHLDMMKSIEFAMKNND